MKQDCRRKREHGAVVVEFALILPLLVTLFVGLTEFGILFYNQQVLTNASREGARAGIAYSVDTASYPTTTQINNVVVAYCNQRMINFGSPPNVQTVIVGAGGPYPNNLNVRARYNYQFLIPGLLGIGSSLNLEAATSMRFEMAPP